MGDKNQLQFEDDDLDTLDDFEDDLDTLDDPTEDSVSATKRRVSRAKAACSQA